MRVAKLIDEDGDTILISPNSVIVQSDDNGIMIKDIGCDDESGWLSIQGTIDEVENELNYALNGLEHLGFEKRVIKTKRFDVKNIISVETATEAKELKLSDEDDYDFVYIKSENSFYEIVKLGGSVAPHLQEMTTESPLSTRIVLENYKPKSDW